MPAKHIKPLPKIIAILGPNAVGKSALAVRLAWAIDGEIISADSRQVYKTLDVGSGKITPKEMQGIPHYLLDVADPRMIFSVEQYRDIAHRAALDILSRGKVPIVCGGTGLYMDALLDGVILPDVPPNPKLRAKLAQKTAEQLFKELKKLDPARARTIEQKNPVRLIRAIEIARALGKVPKRKTKPPFETLRIGLTLPPEKLKIKIDERLEDRIARGMVAEVRRLHAKGLSWKRMQALGLEYRIISNFLQRKISRKEMTDAIRRENWLYGKRQMSWFRRHEGTLWLEADREDLLAEAEKQAKKFLGAKKSR